MKYSQAVKPISYLKAHASEIVRDLTEHQATMIITQHGEAKVVVQDIHLYEQTQESLAMLKILAQSRNSLQVGRFKPVDQAFSDLTTRIEAAQGDA
jgi:prevent-host-death family protein